MDSDFNRYALKKDTSQIYRMIKGEEYRRHKRNLVIKPFEDFQSVVNENVPRIVENAKRLLREDYEKEDAQTFVNFYFEILMNTLEERYSKAMEALE